MRVMAVAVAVRVRFFARLRELAGVELMPASMPAGARVVDVYNAMRVAYPQLPEQAAVRAALNQEFADWGAVVREGDEVAFIPPVSGGR
jgi:molybdopterin converting factor subunit 1